MSRLSNVGNRRGGPANPSAPTRANPEKRSFPSPRQKVRRIGLDGP
jgi:hypothetical protein